MRRLARPLAVVACAALAAPQASVWAQELAEDSAVTFEVASIRSSQTGSTGGGAVVLPGGRWSVTNGTLVGLLIAGYEIPNERIVGGPAWIRADRYDIEARAAGTPAPGEVPRMIQALLRDRFNLLVHTETRDMAVYRLVVAAQDASLGPMLRPAVVDCRDPEARRQAATTGGGPACGFRSGAGLLSGGDMSLETLARVFTGTVGRTVIDRTNLQGRFDVDLRWATSLDDREGVSIFTAIQEQLGLKLEAAHETMDVLVIDRVERPTPN